LNILNVNVPELYDPDRVIFGYAFIFSTIYPFKLYNIEFE